MSLISISINEANRIAARQERRAALAARQEVGDRMTGSMRDPVFRKARAVLSWIYFKNPRTLFNGAVSREAAEEYLRQATRDPRFKCAIEYVKNPRSKILDGGVNSNIPNRSSVPNYERRTTRSVSNRFRKYSSSNTTSGNTSNNRSITIKRDDGTNVGARRHRNVDKKTIKKVHLELLAIGLSVHWLDYDTISRTLFAGKYYKHPKYLKQRVHLVRRKSYDGQTFVDSVVRHKGRKGIDGGRAVFPRHHRKETTILAKLWQKGGSKAVGEGLAWADRVSQGADTRGQTLRGRLWAKEIGLEQNPPGRREGRPQNPEPYKYGGQNHRKPLPPVAGIRNSRNNGNGGNGGNGGTSINLENLDLENLDLENLLTSFDLDNLVPSRNGSGKKRRKTRSSKSSGRTVSNRR